jgi:hypothetical protein
MRFETKADALLLVQRFESCELPLAEFSHAAHVAVATVFLLEEKPEAALVRMREGLLRITRLHGKEHKYSEEVTQKWMEVLGEYVRGGDGEWVEVVNGAVERFGPKQG